MADYEELSFSYLGLLSNAHHDGTTQQILASVKAMPILSGIISTDIVR